MHQPSRPSLNNWRVWAAVGLVAWAGVLQWNMWSVQKDPRFQERFGLSKEEQQQLQEKIKGGWWSIRFKPGSSASSSEQ